LGQVEEGDIAVVRFSAAVIDDGHGVMASENGEMRLRAGDCGAIGGVDIAVVGMSVGECKKMLVPPEGAFGMRDPSLIRELPRSHFRQFPNLKPGSLVKLFSKSGKEIEVVAREVNDNTVTVDANHPLAGMELSFEMTVLAIERSGGRKPAAD
jgi:FKBP-type peptidyl-prolyl cis-trans isomerase 2